MSRWDWPPGLTAGLIITAAGYAAVWRRARLAGRPPRTTIGQLVAWLAGLVAIAIAACSPIDTLSDSSLAVHMVQHELFTFVAAPCLVLGAGPLTIAVLPHLVRPLGRWGHALSRPRVAWIVAAVVLWAWHWPPAYDLALDHPLVHDVEHATLLTAYAFYWSPFVPFGHAVAALKSNGARAAYLVVGGGQASILGAWLAFTGTPRYTHYLVSAASSQAALEDQALGGIIMLLSGAVVFAVAALATMREE